MLEQGLLDSLPQYPLFSPFPPPSSPPFHPPPRYLSSDLQLSLNLNRKLCNYMAPVFYSMDHALNFFFLDHWQQSRKIKPAEKKILGLYWSMSVLLCTRKIVPLVWLSMFFFPIQTSHTVNNIFKWISGYSSIPLKKIKVLIMLT